MHIFSDGCLHVSAKVTMELADHVRLCAPQINGVRTGCKLPYYSAPVLTIAQFDDTQIGQFFLESLPRLLSIFDLLRTYPEMKVHYGFSMKHKNSSQYMSNIQKLSSFRFLKWLGLENRIITGDIASSKVFLPREGACQDPTYNTHELLTMRRKLIQLAWDDECKECDEILSRQGFNVLSSSKLIIVIQRYKAAKYSQNHFDKSRVWGSNDLKTVVEAASSVFVNTSGAYDGYELFVFSDTDSKLMECIPCQIRLFSVAKVVIGVVYLHYDCILTMNL